MRMIIRTMGRLALSALRLLASRPQHAYAPLLGKTRKTEIQPD
jgi:hypothetical protein